MANDYKMRSPFGFGQRTNLMRPPSRDWGHEAQHSLGTSLMAHRAELIENYGSAYTCFATDDGPPHGERGTSGITRGPLARPAAPATRIDSRVGVVINRGVSAVPDAPVQTIEGHNYESALALSKILVAVALEAAQNRIKTKAVKVDAHEAGELEKQLGQIASALSIAQSRLEAPGGLQNRQNRLSIIRGVFEYLVAYPALRKKYAALINPLARFLNIGHGDYVKNQVASVRSPNPTGARLAQNLARTPLEQFTDKSWSEICALCGFTPRLYQESWFEALLLRATNGGDRGILGAPYQVGKTFACFPLAVALSQARFPKKTILIIAPQLKVLDTVIADLERAAPGLRIGRIDADHKDFGQGFDVVVASAWTLGRIENLAGFNATQYGVIATDEAVFLFTQTGGRILNRLGFLDDAGAIRHQADKFLFGFSADVRMRSFARVFGENARLDDKDLPWYVQNKYLHEPVGVRMRYQNLDDATQWEVVNAGGETLSVPTVNLKYISQIYQDCKRRFGDKKFVIFTPNTAHAEAIAAYFNAMEGDGVAYADHSYKETEDNREAEEGFNKGSGPRVLVGVDSLSVGARLVGAVGIVMVYTTSSPRKFGQRLGRILGIHNGEPQRPVTVVEWCGKKIAGRGKQKAWLPQLLGIEDYPGDNVVHRPLQIMSETKTRLPLPKFIVRPDLSGFNLDFVEPETGEKILFSPNRFPAELQYALDTQFDGDAVAMANALRLSEEDLHHYRSGQLPKAYSEVWRMANSLRGDNPAAFVDAWVNDYLDLMQVTYAQDKWREDSAVAQLVSVVRRVSLSADYDVEQGASFACGLELDATEASQLGFVIRGELLDTKGMFTNLDWQTLVKRVILAAREMNEELLNEVLKNAALEVQAEADRRQKREHDRQRRRDAGLPEAEEANHGQGDEFSLDAEEQAFYAVADTLELEEESDEENDLSADTATTTAELEKKTLSEWHDWLSSRIIDLRNRKSLSNEAYVCLHNAGIDTVKDLMELSWAELFIITRAGYDPSLLREIEDMWSGELFNLMWHVESEFDRADLDAAGIARLHALLNQTYSQSGFQFYGEIIQMSEWAWLREANLTPEKFIAAKIDLARQGLYFGMNLHGWQPPVVEVGGATPEDEAIRAVLCKRVDELNISVRTANCLQNAGIEFIWQLVRLTEADVLKTKNSGRKTLNDIKEQLTKLGLTLGMSVNFRALIRETSSVTEQELELASPAAVQALWAKLDVPIQMLDLSVRTANCLQNAGIEYIGQLLRYSDSQSLLKLKNMGRKSLNEIIEFLSRLGLCLGEPTLSWKPPTDRLAEADEIYWSSMDREAAKAGRTLWQGLDRKIDLVDPEMTAVLARKGFLFAGQLAQQTISANFIDSLVADLPVTPANIQYRVSEAIGKYFEGITNLGNFVDRRNNFTMSWKPPTERLVEADLKAIAGRVK